MNPGDSIGPYVIHSSLGAGGMGRVYRARDTRLGRDVALKQLSDRSLTSDVARRRVLQEARAAAGLSHPNIATIFDVLDTDDGPTIVMEYVPGESLARYIARGALPAARSLEIASQIAGGLVEAHARGIVHRDLKPANIQITPEGKAKILDFGVARLTASDADQGTTVTADSKTGRIVGSPAYMAPEQLNGEHADQRSDIYAVGVLLYEMLTGHRPFPSLDLLGSALAVLKGAARPVGEAAPGTPPAVSALVKRAMAKDPSDRFQTAGELARELQLASKALGDATTTLVSVRTVSRRSTRMAIAAIAFLILAGAGWAWRRNADERVVSAPGSVFAVLPFRNTTADPLNDAIAVGLTDAVANRLSSLESIRVLSLDDSREVAKSAKGDAVSAAKSLGATFVVEGDLARAGQMLDVSVTLAGANGERRPVGHYTGEIGQALDLHRRIAQGVIAALSEVKAVPARVVPNPAPTSNQEAFADYAQARLYLERPDDVDHAVTLFQSAISKDDRFALAYAGLGQAYWSKYGQTKDTVWTTKATAAIMDALRIDPRQPEVHLSLAVMYHGLGRFDDAEKELRDVLRMQPWNDDAHRLLAGVHIDRSEWDAAVTELRRAIALRPYYWRNHSELGYAHYRAGRIDEAITAYARAVQLQPDSASALAMLGTALQSAGRLPEALANYTKANEVRPRWSTESNIATIHFWNEEYAKAEEAYQRAIRLAPNMAGLHANLGDTLVKLGQRERARASYRRAVEEIRKQLAVNEKDAQNVARLALYLAKLEDQAGADAAAESALALNPEDGQVVYNAAMIDALANRQAEACGRLAKAVALGTSLEIIRHADELRALKGCQTYDQIVSRR
ncbi:MAG: protein kinase [Vicinamibacterales bacterium]